MATSSRRSCVNDPNVFCYICGEYTLEHNQNLITDFVKQAYLAYFKVKLGDQDKSWAPHIVCKTCIGHLRQWTKKQRKGLRFAIPMVWRKPKDHFSDCYFCGIKTKGINRKNRTSLTEVESRTQGSRPRPKTQKNPRPRPRTAFPRTDTLEAKAKDQGHKRKCSPKTKKKVVTKIFQANSKKKKKGSHKNFSGDLHKKTFSKKFFKRSTKF